MSDPGDARARLREEAERLLQGITPGEWFVNYKFPMFVGYGVAIQRGAEIGTDCGLYIGRKHEVPIADLEFIAAAPRLVRELLASSLAPEAVRDWQPIATAPKDSGSILVWCPENLCQFLVCWYQYGDEDGYWTIFGGGHWRLEHVPTLWRPRPASPEPPDGR